MTDQSEQTHPAAACVRFTELVTLADVFAALRGVVVVAPPDQIRAVADVLQEAAGGPDIGPVVILDGASSVARRQAVLNEAIDALLGAS